MPKKIDKRKLMKKMDDLFSKIIRSQGECDRCGKKDDLQCSHVISRRHLQTRWDLDNAIPLCYRCHIHWQHKEPHEFVRWFDAKYGGNLYDEIKKRTNKVEKINYEEKYASLKEIYASL